MVTQCTICRDDRVSTINDKLLKGMSARAAAQEFGLGRGAMTRHMQHMAQPAPGQAEKAVLNRILDNLAIADEADQFGLEKAKAEDFKEIPRFTKGIREGALVTGKLTGILKDGETRSTVNVQIITPPMIERGTEPARLAPRPVAMDVRQIPAPSSSQNVLDAELEPCDPTSEPD